MKTLLAGAITAAMLASGAFAAGPANPTHLKDHPRVNQVNRRVADQRARIVAGEKSGKISKTQAAQLGQERHQLKTEEHGMRKADGGHLTTADQKALNQQLNARSKQIYQEKH